MKTAAITIQVTAEVADAYHAASEEERRKMDLLANLQLTEFLRSPESVEEIMEEMSRAARQNGLSPAMLHSILHG
jgi:hypothetical protein